MGEAVFFSPHKNMSGMKLKKSGLLQLSLPYFFLSSMQEVVGEAVLLIIFSKIA